MFARTTLGSRLMGKTLFKCLILSTDFHVDETQQVITPQFYSGVELRP